MLPCCEGAAAGRCSPELVSAAGADWRAIPGAPPAPDVDSCSPEPSNGRCWIRRVILRARRRLRTYRRFWPRTSRSSEPPGDSIRGRIDRTVHGLIHRRRPPGRSASPHGPPDAPIRQRRSLMLKSHRRSGRSRSRHHRSVHQHAAGGAARTTARSAYHCASFRNHCGHGGDLHSRHHLRANGNRDPPITWPATNAPPGTARLPRPRHPDSHTSRWSRYIREDE